MRTAGQNNVIHISAQLVAEKQSSARNTLDPTNYNVPPYKIVLSSSDPLFNTITYTAGLQVPHYIPQNYIIWTLK